MPKPPSYLLDESAWRAINLFIDMTMEGAVPVHDPRVSPDEFLSIYDHPDEDEPPYEGDAPSAPQRDGGYVELTGDNLPYHLRPDAKPLAHCTRCKRETFDALDIGTLDTMTQPDGDPCSGTFVAGGWW